MAEVRKMGEPRSSGRGRALTSVVRLNGGWISVTHTLLPGGQLRWLCIRQSATRKAESRKG